MSGPDDRVDLHSLSSPHHLTRVDRATYEARRKALLTVPPDRERGPTVAEAQVRLHRPPRT